MGAVRVILFLAAALAVAGGAEAALVEHTFVVSQIKLNHLCNDTLVTVVNGQLPGPTIEVTEGDSVVVHVINKAPHGLTIHWHGVKQQLNCWADGPGMITQCPIQQNTNFTYRFNVTGQEGTLWWHAHVGCLRATVHGALIIRPRSGPSSYPFPKPDKEIPIVIGEWWDVDIVQMERNIANSNYDDRPHSTTLNGKLGDLNNCSGVVEENYNLHVEHGKTYLLRIVNAALHSEFYLKVAGHTFMHRRSCTKNVGRASPKKTSVFFLSWAKFSRIPQYFGLGWAGHGPVWLQQSSATAFMVVATDANYVKPYTTDIIAITPGETVDALMVADAPPGKYYMVALTIQSPEPMLQFPVEITRGIVYYNNLSKGYEDTPAMDAQMTHYNDVSTTFYFHGNLTSLPHPLLYSVPASVDERMIITTEMGYMCNKGESDCNYNLVARMNNISFQLPMTTPLLQVHYYHNMTAVGVQEFPSSSPPNLVVNRGTTMKGTSVKRVRYNTTLEIVFQGPSTLFSFSNPMHLHGHDFFILAQGLGNYDAEKDVQTYNLVDPPVRNMAYVPRFGWIAIRFVASNPGVWFLHCHFEKHVSSGMAMALLVEDGPTLDTTLPPPPADYPTCNYPGSEVAYI